MIDDIIIEYPDTNNFVQQKLNEKCDREGMPIDKFCFNKSRSKPSMFKSVISLIKILKGA